MQTQDARNPQYKSMVHCMKSMVAKDGSRGLYRGMSSPMVINNRKMYFSKCDFDRKNAIIKGSFYILDWNQCCECHCFWCLW